MKRSNYILGICCYFHDSSACLLKDGKLIAMAEEERFNRQKHTFSFPIESIRFCLKKADIQFNQVDQIAYGFLPWKFIWNQIKQSIVRFPSSVNLLVPGASYMPLVSKIWLMTTLKRTFSYYFKNPTPPISYVSHHLAHAYSSYWVSKFDKAAVLVVDGFGEDTATSLYKGEKDKIEHIISLPYSDSLGVYYGAITQYLGFKPHFDEYKVMGMAAYGRDRFTEIFKDILNNIDDSPWFKLNTDYIGFYTHGVRQWYSKKLVNVLGPPRQKNAKYRQIHFDIACSAQRRIEEVIIELGSYLRKITGSKNLCIAGGVAQNVLANRVLLDRCGFKKIYIPPVAYDGGCSLGAALAIYSQDRKSRRNFSLDKVDWGPSFTDEECKVALERVGLGYKIGTDFSDEVSSLLTQGKIVGYFNGSMEIGPRALGNRSIIADPRRVDMKDILNKRIKKREFFRPFAPMVIMKDAKRYFDLPVESPFMTLSAYVKKPELLPAVTHHDGTARVQTVKKDFGDIYNLLKSFGLKTGVPVLLNTSFNENEPIVCTPEEAIDCFLRTKMDVLVFNNRLLVLRK